MATMEDLSNKMFNSWTANSYAGNYKWNCTCSCGETKIVSAYDLKHNKSRSCFNCSKKTKTKPQVDLTNIGFGELVCIEYLGGSKWKCKCSCGKETETLTSSLINGTTKSCGHLINTPKINLSNMKFGDWEVLYYTEKGMWMCKCSCGNTRLISEYNLKNGKTTSCGHKNANIDITNEQFGRLKALRNAGNRYWLCECQCGKKLYVQKHKLLNGSTKSCGCMLIEKRKRTSIDRYGVDVFNPRCPERTQQQIDYTKDRESMLDLLLSLTINESKPYVFELSNALNIGNSAILRYLHQYELEDYASIGVFNTSSYEQEIYNMFPYAIRNDRKTLNGLELDLLYTEHNIAIEFNGNYWHSSDMVCTTYHQDKTISCAKQGIQLIHIFEYEWNNPDTKRKIIALLKSKIEQNNLVIYARKCVVRQIDGKVAKQFLKENHLQQDAPSSVYIGIEDGNGLLGVMTFGVSRFDTKFDWELVRLAFKQNIIVVGGTEKLFRFFLREFNPVNIISYCDISKFTGNSYTRLGFKSMGITIPNYVWVKGDRVLSRYQTQKYKLIADGLGTKEMTETDIMKSIGYFKIHDSGNLRLEWRKEVK